MGRPPSPGTLLWTVVALVLAYCFQVSRAGLRLRASREDLVAARGIGVPVERDRLAAFVLSAFITGIAGAVLAQHLGSVVPTSFYINAAFIVIAMLVIGGTHSLTGAVVGAVVVTTLTSVFREFQDGVEIAGVTASLPGGVGPIFVAVIMLVVLAVRPEGLTGGKDVRVVLRRSGPRKRRATPTVETSSQTEGT